MKEQFAIIERFEITNRGAVVVIDEVTARTQGQEYRVELISKEGTKISTTAFKEWLLRRDPEPIEKEAYMLKGLHASDIKDCEIIAFI